MYMKRWRSFLPLLVVAALLAWTGYAILREQTPEQLIQAVTAADWRLLLLGVAIMVVFICCEAKLTHGVLQALGCAQSFLRCCYYSCAGFFFSAVTPSATGGQPAQVLLMGKDGVPGAVGTLDMLLVTVGYNTATVGYGFAALLGAGHLMEQLGGQVGLLLGVGLSVFTAIDGLMLVFLFLPNPARRLCQWLIKIAVRIRPSLDKEGLGKKAEGYLEEYRRGAELVRSSPMLMLKVLALSFCQRTCTYAIPYIVYRAFGLSGVSLWELLALQALCAIAVGYLPLPGSAGAAENVFLRGFVLAYGQGLVAPAMLLSRTINCYLVVAVTGLILLAGRLYRKRWNNEGGSQPYEA